MTIDEALKLALEALESMKETLAEHDEPTTFNEDQAITSIKKALAQPEQEPVAWMYPDDYERMTTSETFCTVYSVEVGSATRGESTVALYTTPPQRTWVGLTDKVITKVVDSMPRGINGWMSDWDLYEFARAIEAKLKENNSAA